MALRILTLNAGSSSIKFALFARQDELVELIRGQVEGVGARARFTATVGEVSIDEAAPTATDHRGALGVILEFTNRRHGRGGIAAVGHRVVHGGPNHAAPIALDDAVIADLGALSRFAPLHQPHNLAGIAAARAAFPDAIQVACFDTAFHRAHPWVNDTFALPRAYYDKGIRRYGFHGLSYDHVSHELTRIAPDVAAGRVVIAHLGNGASMCALKGGDSVGSTMGFTALDGLPMGTRCGQLDPGVVLYLMDGEGMDADAITHLLYHESGLKGLSGLSHDMRVLEAADTPEAAQAIDYFVFRVRRELGAMAAVLGGLDALVFCGGIGENAWRIRDRICAGFDWLGMSLDAASNQAGARRIAAAASAVAVFVIPTDEEIAIARATAALLGGR